MRVLRSPLLHFSLLGAAIFGLQSFRPEPAGSTDRYRIEIGARQVEDLSRDFERRVGRAPDHHELSGLIDSEAEEEMLFREAVALGLLESDGGVQTRLLQKMLFLEGEAVREEAADLLARAVALRLHEDDVVVRRILVQKMRLIGSSLRADQAVSPEEIQATYGTQRESLRAPDRLDLTHVFLSRDLHGPALGRVADEVGVRLRRGGMPVRAAIALGQAFPFGHQLERQSRADLDRRFGPGFGEAVFETQGGAWSEPIESAYGLHLVRVTDRERGEPPPLEHVADRLRLEIEADRRLTNLDTLLGSLRARYHVRVEAIAPGPAGPTRTQEPG
jgi:hypothetical protein